MNHADSPAKARSPISDRLIPAPAAAPLIAQISGARIRVKREIAACRYVVSSLTSSASSGPAGGHALMSAPAQNIRPAPVRITARTSSDSSQRIDASMNSLPIAMFSAFAASGRLKRIVTTPPSWLQSSVS